MQQKSTVNNGAFLCAPTEIRTLVLALKGLRPGPLDDGGFLNCGRILPLPGVQVKELFESIGVG